MMTFMKTLSALLRICSPYPHAPLLTSPHPLPSLPLWVEVDTQWAEWIHFNWQVPVALWPGYVQWVIHEGPTWFGFQWGMTLSGANGLSVCVCVFVHTCICSPNPASNEHWQSQISIRWQLACQSLFMDSFGFDCALQWAGVMNNITYGNTLLCFWKWFPNHALNYWKTKHGRQISTRLSEAVIWCQTASESQIEVLVACLNGKGNEKKGY